MSDAAITITGLAKAFSAIVALDDIDFSEHYIRTTPTPPQHPQHRAGRSLRPDLRPTDSIDRAR
jgi:hypothetical protein